MEFKHLRDRRVWSQGIMPYDKAANARLKELVGLIDQFSILAGWGPITVTSYFRPDDKDSYHSLHQAVDIRTRDKPVDFKAKVGALGSILWSIDRRLQIFAHVELWGKPQEHFHIAIKDGKIQRDKH